MSQRFAEPPALRRLVFEVALWLLLTLYLVVPVSTVMEPNLDSSIRATYSLFTAHGFQFGSQVNTTAGPYGFVMYGWDYSGELFWSRFVLIILFAAGMSALILWFFKNNASQWRWLWLVTAVLGIEYGDNQFNIALLLGGLFLLTNAERREKRLQTILVIILLSCLSLTKGPQLALAAGIVATVIGLAAFRRAWRAAALVAATFLIALMSWWVLAGQNPLHLPTYVNHLRHIAQGYNEAMALYESPVLFRIGLALLLILLSSLWLVAWLRRREPVLVASCVLLSGITWVAWKHGYVRTDGHAFVFLDLGVVLALTLIVLTSPARGASPAPIALRAGSGVLAAATILLALSGSETLERGRFRGLLANVGPRLVRNVAFVFSPEHAQQNANETFKTRQNVQTSNFVRTSVGRTPIDFYGHQMGVLLLDHLNYQPAPMCCGSYHVYNRHFKELNCAHFSDPRRRPGFVLLKIQSIDERFVACDDSLSLLAFLDLYRPVVFEHHSLLLQARTEERRAEKPMVILRRRFRFDEDIVLPQVRSDELVLFSVALPSSVRGAVRAFAYKPPLVQMHLEGDGLENESYRVLPESLAVNSLLSPALENTDDYLALYAETLTKRVKRLRLTTSAPENFRSSGMYVTFSVVRRPPALSTDEFRRVLLASVYEDPPAAVDPASATVDDYKNRRVQYLHTPASFTFDLRGDERSLSMTIGLDEQAYLTGRTDGVDFQVELVEPSGPPRLLQRRLLRPLDQPADRGFQTLTAPLPPFFATGSKLRVRSDPGPNRDASWDWAFATDVKFARGRFVNEQFPGFKVLPFACEGRSVSVQSEGAKQVVVISAPGGMTFSLNGTERELLFNGGMLESSYTTGATDGVTFVLEYALPDGEPKRLFSRSLQPKTTASDRGEQGFAVTLPPTPAGSRLILRADPGPNGNNSFDWAYVSSLELR